ncbi:DMT family transporter [Roseospira marina]|uniref:DMT family transporter n=1 Tax=Roseospira marina TaxID=140057 RepID=A0A5M6IGY5_9PROT|nr:DMT family transporter [Roseospira marina]KAA5607009.1 DMT family transporter [Roseospira marina]MBB4312807.1 drug/metabolite transporter (DMT)-like permease [Roseospira marina]MBB5086420.1 drug/metabolite transporter (DMT)-like permease [Roseospira marina]
MITPSASDTASSSESDLAQLTEDGPARRALPLLLLGAVLIGFSPVFAKLSPLEPTATAFYRSALAVPILMAAALMTTRRAPAGHRKARPTTWRDHLMLAAPGLAFSGDLACWHWALQYTSVANSTVLANLAPVFVTFGAWALFGQRPSGLFVVGLVTGIAGVGLLVADSLTVGAPNQVFGDGLGVATAVFYGAYILGIGWSRTRFPTAVVMAWSTLHTAWVLLLLSLLMGEGLAIPTLYALALLLGLAWFSHSGGQGAIAFALAHLPPAFGSVSLLLQPAVAAFLGWLVLSEPLTPLQGLGAIVILSGIVIARRASARQSGLSAPPSPGPPASANGPTVL